MDTKTTPGPRAETLDEVGLMTPTSVEPMPGARIEFFEVDAPILLLPGATDRYSVTPLSQRIERDVNLVVSEA